MVNDCMFAYLYASSFLLKGLANILFNDMAAPKDKQGKDRSQIASKSVFWPSDQVRTTPAFLCRCPS